MSATASPNDERSNARSRVDLGGASIHGLLLSSCCSKVSRGRGPSGPYSEHPFDIGAPSFVHDEIWPKVDAGYRGSAWVERARRRGVKDPLLLVGSETPRKAGEVLVAKVSGSQIDRPRRVCIDRESL
jgi:hypothetical protein